MADVQKDVTLLLMSVRQGASIEALSVFWSRMYKNVFFHISDPIAYYFSGTLTIENRNILFGPR